MQIKNVLLAGCLISALSANDPAQNIGAFVFKNGSEQSTAQDFNLKEDKNIIYVKDISGIGESLEIAKKDAIQNAMRFGVGELLVSKEELNNDELRQEITNYSNAYILDYKQTHEANENGVYKVKADVMLEKNKVLGTLSKLNINVLDLSSGILKNYAEDKAEKKDNAEKLIKNEIVEPFQNGYAYNLEILDMQPLNRSDLIKARSEKGRNFKDLSLYKEAKIIDELYMVKVKIKLNNDYVKKAEKIISQFSEKSSNNANNQKQTNFIVDNRSYFISDDYIRKEIFNNVLDNIGIYGFSFRLIDKNNELWNKKCVTTKIPFHSYDNAYSYYSHYFENPERQFISKELFYFFELKKIKKITENDKNDNIEYYYKDFDYIGNSIVNLSNIVNPKQKFKLKNGLIDYEFLNFNTKEQIFYIVIQLDKQDIANINKIEFNFLYTENNECNN
ncbi:hypothetical protein CSHOW_0863 [Campylobacter showae]|uniref:Flagellar assembly protein T N-terminal domain-containing protein n=1 Tax=Campylobacter showae RM3277 TaxID=553219 RepID=C6RFJ7_9BACT|nr:hypothetical protein [Campylobacter showae]EET80005.1 hypothetical protein CAMSH0001_0503 [Campylobacter showae RM3277]QCD48803.1 hypothetical protein CSHOW_0863 [Campylobacter showae]